MRSATDTTLSRETLVGSVERVTFHNEENGFAVLKVKARGKRDLVAVVGHAASISAGEFVHAVGVWTTDRTHGLQFKAELLKTTAPTTAEGIEKYLGSGMVRGIGPKLSQKESSTPSAREPSKSSRRVPRSRGTCRGSENFAPARSPPAGPSKRPFAKSWCFCIPMASGRRVRCVFSRPTGMTPFR